MPGIHALGIAAQAARFAAAGGQQVQIAIGLQQHERLRPAEDDPLAVGRELGEVIAQAVMRRPGERLRLAPFAAVERDTVQIEKEQFFAPDEFLHLLGGEQGGFLVRAVQEVPGLAAGKNNPLAVRAPDRVALHEVGSSAPDKAVIVPVVRSYTTRMPLTGKKSCENFRLSTGMNTDSSLTVLIT